MKLRIRHVERRQWGYGHAMPLRMRISEPQWRRLITMQINTAYAQYLFATAVRSAFYLKS